MYSIYCTICVFVFPQAGRSSKRQLFLFPGGIERHVKIKTCTVGVLLAVHQHEKLGPCRATRVDTVVFSGCPGGDWGTVLWDGFTQTGGHGRIRHIFSHQQRWASDTQTVMHTVPLSHSVFSSLSVKRTHSWITYQTVLWFLALGESYSWSRVLISHSLQNNKRLHIHLSFPITISQHTVSAANNTVPIFLFITCLCVNIQK